MSAARIVDVPWAKHLCFLESEQARREARQAVRLAAERGWRHPCVLAYSIGNEIPPNIVRWHGRRRVERFLAELQDVARQADPAGLVTYANFPSTEYLDLSFLDFATFNVYLHDREAFTRYLFRLQNLAGDVPLVLGELGMDTLRHGEAEQAEFLAGHLREAALLGLAGAFIFSWTEFLLSLFLTTTIRTVPVKITTFVTSTGSEWGFISALGTAAILPGFIFILLVQRHLVRGLTLGSLKE